MASHANISRKRSGRSAIPLIGMRKKQCLPELINIIICTHQVVVGGVASYLLYYGKSFLVKRDNFGASQRSVSDEVDAIALNIGNETDCNSVFNIEIAAERACYKKLQCVV